MTICLHMGAERVSFDALSNVDTPKATYSHTPVPHHELVEMVRSFLDSYGHEVVDEVHGVTPDGCRYFGLMNLRSKYNDYTDTVGLRNSHDKKLPVGVGFGSRVFVCDNLAFVADHIIKRKHTRYVMRDTSDLVYKLIGQLANQRERQAELIDLYKRTELTVNQTDHAIMRMYRDDVLNLNRIPIVLSEMSKPANDNTAWPLFNAVTASLNGRVYDKPMATPRLFQIMEDTCRKAA